MQKVATKFFTVFKDNVLQNKKVKNMRLSGIGGIGAAVALAVVLAGCGRKPTTQSNASQKPAVALQTPAQVTKVGAKELAEQQNRVARKICTEGWVKALYGSVDQTNKLLTEVMERQAEKTAVALEPLCKANLQGLFESGVLSIDGARLNALF